MQKKACLGTAQKVLTPAKGSVYSREAVRNCCYLDWTILDYVVTVRNAAPDPLNPRLSTTRVSQPLLSPGL